MRKIGVGIYAGLLVAAVLVALTRCSWANLKVDASSSGCLECHEVGVFGAGDGSIHGSHSNCVDCHEGTSQKGNVFSSSCLICHPDHGSEKCDLVNFHENSLDYTPEDFSCLHCHGTCGSSTTTTTTPPGTIWNSRYEIFLIGPFREGCRATTVEFRSDNVLVLDCLDGFGTYLSVGNLFIAVYWSNNYYLGYGLGMVLSGFAVDSYIFAGGIAYFEKIVSTVAMSGYVL